MSDNVYEMSRHGFQVSASTSPSLQDTLVPTHPVAPIPLIYPSSPPLYYHSALILAYTYIAPQSIPHPAPPAILL